MHEDRAGQKPNADGRLPAQMPELREGVLGILGLGIQAAAVREAGQGLFLQLEMPAGGGEAVGD